VWQPSNPGLLPLPPQPQQSALRPPHDNPSSEIWDLRLFGSHRSTPVLNGHVSAACLDREGEGSGVEALGDGSRREALRPGSCAHPLTPPCLHIASAWHVPPVFTQTLPILQGPSHGAPFSFPDFTPIHLLQAPRALCFMAIATFLLESIAPRYTFVLSTESSQRSARCCSFCAPYGACPCIMVESTLYHELAMWPPYVLSLSEPHFPFPRLTF